MEQTLKITNVLADPTRFSIYEYITQAHRDVTVQEIAEEFNIHPNVARLHLSKLEDVEMLKSENKKTGKGGRPSRLYRLSDEVIELNFPFRDYRLLAKIAIETMRSLGKEAETALQETGRRYATELVETQLAKGKLTKEQLTFDNKVEILKTTSSMLGFYPEIFIKNENNSLLFQIYNCPFKEVAMQHRDETCDMHVTFINGLLEALFDDVDVKLVQNMLDGCQSCAYSVNISN